jgi:hypothetical protein
MDGLKYEEISIVQVIHSRIERIHYCVLLMAERSLGELQGFQVPLR